MNHFVALLISYSVNEFTQSADDEFRTSKNKRIDEFLRHIIYTYGLNNTEQKNSVRESYSYDEENPGMKSTVE